MGERGGGRGRGRGELTFLYQRPLGFIFLGMAALEMYIALSQVLERLRTRTGQAQVRAAGMVRLTVGEQAVEAREARLARGTDVLGERLIDLVELLVEFEKLGMEELNVGAIDGEFFVALEGVDSVVKALKGVREGLEGDVVAGAAGTAATGPAHAAAPPGAAAIGSVLELLALCGGV